MTFPLGSTRLRVAVFPVPERLVEWCRRTGHRYALTGGFFSRRTGQPLGRVWTGGEVVQTAPWGREWAHARGALHVQGAVVRIAPLGELPTEPSGDLLTAGPMLVREGRSLIGPDYHFEGIPETWRYELDADWTSIRAQRSAIGTTPGQILAVVCDGSPVDLVPDPTEAGLTIAELAHVMVELGAEEALNLDGGGGTSMVCDQLLVNRPRAGPGDVGHQHGAIMPDGRAIYTALTFALIASTSASP